MGKKLWLIIGGVILLAVVGVVAFRFRTSSSLLSPVAPETEREPIKLATWEDPAGFSFSYPEDIGIDPHDEDQENYAHLELTSPDHQGKIIIWVKETGYNDIKEWVKGEAAGGGQIFDTELGGEPAKKIAYLNPEKLVTAAIDIDALVLVEMMPDRQGYWQGVYEKILSSFAFIPLKGEKAVAPGPWEGSGGAGGMIEEPEEVIE